MSRWNGRALVVIGAVALLLSPSTALAYVGPGGVLTAIGAMLAVFVAIIAAFAGFLWYPLKRFLAWVQRARGRAETGGVAPKPPL